MFKKALVILASVGTVIATTAITITNGTLTFGPEDTALLNGIVQAIVSNVWNVVFFVAIPMVALAALYLAVRAVMGFVRSRQSH